MDRGDPEAACHSSTCRQIDKGPPPTDSSMDLWVIDGLSMAYLVDDVVLIARDDAEITAKLPIQSLVARFNQ